MLFCNADIKTARRVAFVEQVQASAVGHGCGDGDDFTVFLGLTDQRIGEDFRIARRVRRRFLLLASDHIELGRRMAAIRCLFRRSIAFALLGDHMDHHWPIGTDFDGAQDAQKLFHVMAINRADIGKAQLLKQCAAHGCGFKKLFRPACAFLERLWQKRDSPLGRSFHFLKRRARVKSRQVG